MATAVECMRGSQCGSGSFTLHRLSGPESIESNEFLSTECLVIDG